MEGIICGISVAAKQRIVAHIISIGADAQRHNFKVITKLLRGCGKRYRRQFLSQTAQTAFLAASILACAFYLVTKKLYIMCQWFRFVGCLCALRAIHGKTNVPASIKGQIAAHHCKTIAVFTRIIFVLCPHSAITELILIPIRLSRQNDVSSPPPTRYSSSFSGALNHVVACTEGSTFW